MAELKQILNLLSSGSNMINKGMQARRKASRLRKQKSVLKRGSRGIPSNASQLRTTTSSARGFSNLPHHNIRIHEVFYSTIGSYAPGDYKLSLKVTPFKWLQASPFSPLLDIYEKMRINTYKISVYIPTFSPVAKASSASWLARDSTAVTGIDSYTKILEQQGHKRGRGHTVHTYNWKPVEPEDLDYRPCALAFDNSDWGTLLYSMIAAISEFPETPNALIEYSATYSFANLKSPTEAASNYAHINWQEYSNIPPLNPPIERQVKNCVHQNPHISSTPRPALDNETEQFSEQEEDDSISVVDIASSELSTDEYNNFIHLLEKMNLTRKRVK